MRLSQFETVSGPNRNPCPEKSLIASYSGLTLRSSYTLELRSEAGLNMLKYERFASKMIILGHLHLATESLLRRVTGRKLHRK